MATGAGESDGAALGSEGAGGEQSENGAKEVEEDSAWSTEHVLIFTLYFANFLVGLVLIGMTIWLLIEHRATREVLRSDLEEKLRSGHLFATLAGKVSATDLASLRQQVEANEGKLGKVEKALAQWTPAK